MYFPGDVVRDGMLSVVGYCPWGNVVRGILPMGDNAPRILLTGSPAHLLAVAFRHNFPDNDQLIVEPLTAIHMLPFEVI